MTCVAPDRNNFNNACFFPEFNTHPLRKAATDCCARTIVTIDDGCVSYCNFTSVPTEIDLLNCVVHKGAEEGLSEQEVVNAYPDCPAEINRGINFTWISNTLTTTAFRSTSTSFSTRFVTLPGSNATSTTTIGNGGVGNIVSGSKNATTSTTSSSELIATTNPPPSVVTNTAANKSTPTPTSSSSAANKAGLSMGSLMLVALAFWGALFQS